MGTIFHYQFDTSNGDQESRGAKFDHGRFSGRRGTNSTVVDFQVER
jgi:hypothetical protein